MSQGSNFKKEVMEALSNAPTNLITSKAFMWAATNLPDEGGMGNFTVSERGNYNHEETSFWRAIGMPEEEPRDIHNKIAEEAEKFVKNFPGDSIGKSHVFQHIEKTCGNNGMMYLAMLGFMELHERWTGDSNDVDETLGKLLKMLKRGGKL
ncbi:MAG: hypothetical protein EBU90_22020 [Proteobacteria bacterium]|nr:hypothetical protein [Pseudomonadota bacterium]